MERLSFEDYIEQINFIDYLINREGYSINEKESKFVNGFFKYAQLERDSQKLILLSPSKNGAKSYYILFDRGSGRSYNLIDYLNKIKCMSYQDINTELASYLNLPVKTYTKKIIQSQKPITTNWYKFLEQPLTENNTYLKDRGILDIALQYNNIYENNNKVLFPLINLKGKIVGLEEKDYKTLFNPKGNKCYKNTIKENSFFIHKNYSKKESPQYIIIAEHTINILSLLKLFHPLDITKNLLIGTGGQFSITKIKQLNVIFETYKYSNIISIFDKDLTGFYFDFLILQELLPIITDVRKDSENNKIIVKIEQSDSTLKKLNDSKIKLPSERIIKKEDLIVIPYNQLEETLVSFNEILTIFQSRNITFFKSKLNDFNDDLMLHLKLNKSKLVHIGENDYNAREQWLNNKIKTNTETSDIKYYQKELNKLPTIYQKLTKGTND